MSRIYRSLPAALAALALAAVALGQTGAGHEPIGRPDPSEGPTPLSVGLYLIDLYDVDDVHQTFEADVVLTVQWRDPRLAVDALGAAGERTFGLPEIWHPDAQILNVRSVDRGLPEQVRVAADGACLYRQRFTGTFGFRADLHAFPFDRQEPGVTVVFPLTAGPVQPALDDAFTGVWEDVSVVNWHLADSVQCEVQEKHFPQLGSMETVTFRIELRRETSYYLWHVLMPLVIVVVMSWAVFYISPTVPLRLSLGATAVLTLIAFRFAVASLLPPIAYLTRLDVFLAGSSVLVLGALIEALVAVTLAERGRLALALQIDRISRSLFPLAFAVLTWLAFGR